MGGTPPIGPSGPVASPSPNAGKEAAAIGKVRQAVSQLQSVVPDLDISSPLGGAVLKAIEQLSKHAPAVQAQPGAGVQSLKDQLMKAMQGGPGGQLQRMMASGPQSQPAAPPVPPAEG